MLKNLQEDYNKGIINMEMSSKKTLAQFGMLAASVPTNRRRKMDEFMKVGNKMYGTINTANDSITNYGGSTYSRKSPLNTEEYFGSIKANKGANIDAEKFKENIRQAEGLRLEPYKDTKGYDTVGYGHLLIDGRTGNISVDRIDKEDAEKLLQQDIEVRLKEVNALLPDFKNFPEDAQQAIFSEYYRGSIGQSDVTRALINKRRYKDAAKEFLNNDEYKEAKKNGKLGGITKRFEAVSKALMKMAEEKKEEVNLPIRKPSKEEMTRLGFRYGGGADSGAGASGMGSAGRGRGGARDGGNPGGNNRDKSNNSKQGQTPGGPGKGRRSSRVAQKSPSTTSTNTPSSRPTMADISGPTKKTGGNFLGNLKKQGQNILTKKVPSKTKAVASKIKSKLNYNLYGTSINSFKNTDFKRSPVQSTLNAFNQGLLSGTNFNAYGQVGGLPGVVSVGLQNTLSAENVRDLNFKGTETDVVGGFGTNIKGIDVTGKYNFGEDTGSIGVSKNLGSLFGKDITGGVQVTNDGKITPTFGVSFKKGGLLDRGR